MTNPFILTLEEHAEPYELTAEKNLMAAVLIRALTDLDVSYTRMRRIGKDAPNYAQVRMQFEEVAAWFMDDNERDLFSFASICEHLNADPQAVRKRIYKNLNSKSLF